MFTYIAGFIFYTLAMIGIMFVAFMVYKKFVMPTKMQSKSMIKVLDVLSLGPKKMLYVIKVKDERFLIASDGASMTFLSKLKEDNISFKNELNHQIAVENLQKEPEILLSEPNERKMNDISMQFQELYSKTDEDNKPIEFEKRHNRKEMIRKLLKDLNSTNSSQGQY
ncbi:FliO/MopB family protein [bacterium]|nr:FliO/MopB family protein [bacterium]